jgi:glycosyltransferase involved in cell wall biosynthesis
MDNGIYDAMNKGNRLANGDYILFLNSDDYLYSKDSIKEFVDHCHSEYFPLIIAKVKIAIDDDLNCLQGHLRRNVARPAGTNTFINCLLKRGSPA